jgi:plasmid stabilization system protein ParE
VKAIFEITPQAMEDLDSIWWFIAGDSREAADRVEREIIATCQRLARFPLTGSRRPDITGLPVRFRPVTRYPNYLIVYSPDTAPLQVIAILHGKREIQEVLSER